MPHDSVSDFVRYHSQNRAHRNVSIKIVVAHKSGKLDHELHILTYLKQSNTSHPGYKHIIPLLDFFYHVGPNGRHLCLVFNVLGPSTSSIAERGPNYRLDGHLARDVSAQVLLAVDYLHTSGIVHGGEPIFSSKSNYGR